MDTFFAPAERTSEDVLHEEIVGLASHPVLQELLHGINALIAILDEHRQVIALNESFLRNLGIDDAQAVLGLRPGQVLGCIHCDGEPNGCGTTKYCSSCGAAIAIVSALARQKPAEKLCALTASRGGNALDRTFLVKASPLKLEGRRYILLFLQDVTLEQVRGALERTFFHDISNMLTGLLGVSQLLASAPTPRLLDVVHQSALRLCKEVAIQKCLFKNDMSEFRVAWEEVTAQALLSELRNVYQEHRASRHKALELQDPLPAISIITDVSLALRVMCNMVTNALEATDDQGVVKLWFEQEGNSLVFSVWNDKAIPEMVRHRIFLRSFSTKQGNGRGIGTYSMKLIGEKLLCGKVTFASSESEGTVFRFVFGNGNPSPL